MPSTSNPFGLDAKRHPSGIVRANRYTIATGYAANIFKGDQVKLVTAGTIELGTSDGTRTGTVTANDIIGVFAGCEYTDANGVPVVSPYWPTGTAATNIVAWVWDDPATVFEVQGTGTAYVQADIGAQANWAGFTAPGGSTLTGLSSSSLNTVLSTTAQGQWRIVDIAPDVDNAFGDSYVKVLVEMARHQYVANKLGI